MKITYSTLINRYIILTLFLVLNTISSAHANYPSDELYNVTFSSHVEVGMLLLCQTGGRFEFDCFLRAGGAWDNPWVYSDRRYANDHERYTIVYNADTGCLKSDGSIYINTAWPNYTYLKSDMPGYGDILVAVGVIGTRARFIIQYYDDSTNTDGNCITSGNEVKMGSVASCVFYCF